jgi:hypothetical protein
LASAVFQSDAAIADSAEATAAERGGEAGVEAALFAGGTEDEEPWAKAVVEPESRAENKTKRANRTTNCLA